MGVPWPLYSDRIENIFIYSFVCDAANYTVSEECPVPHCAVCTVHRDQGADIAVSGDIMAVSAHCGAVAPLSADMTSPVRDGDSQ